MSANIEKVAATMVRGLKAGDFCITFGVEGYLLGLGTAGFAPCFSVPRAACQVRLVLLDRKDGAQACYRYRMMGGSPRFLRPLAVCKGGALLQDHM